MERKGSTDGHGGGEAVGVCGYSGGRGWRTAERKMEPRTSGSPQKKGKKNAELSLRTLSTQRQISQGFRWSSRYRHHQRKG